MPRTAAKEKMCIGCGAYLDDDNCRKIVHICEEDRIYETFPSKCVICQALYSKERRETLRGFLCTLLHHAKRSAERRKSKGREEAGVFDLTLDRLIEIYNKQNGKCYYSNIQMNTKSATNWMCSLERLDNDKGYTGDNVALVCLEFNNGTKWSKEKIDELLLEIRKEINYDEIMKDIDDATILKRKKLQRRQISYKMIKGVKHWDCDSCGEYKTMNEYCTTHPGCIKCRALDRKKHYDTIRGHLKKLLCHANDHTRMRKNTNIRKNNKNIEDVFDITYADVIEILKKQHGLCYYSGIRMNYGSYLEKNWVASLERINPFKGSPLVSFFFIFLDIYRLLL